MNCSPSTKIIVTHGTDTMIESAKYVIQAWSSFILLGVLPYCFPGVVTLGLRIGLELGLGLGLELG